MGKNKIIIHIPPRIYFGGDVIYGVVELQIRHKIKYRGVRFLFAATEKTRTEDGNGTQYSEILVFLSYRLDLMGTPRHLRNNAKAEELLPGIYRFPFAIVLPKRLPPSDKFGYNSITYRASAYVDIPLGFDLAKHVDIRIDGDQRDAIEFAKLKPPAVKQNRKSFLFAHGKLYMRVGIQTVNYFVGDVARITVNVDNDSSKNVEDIKVCIWNVRVNTACGMANVHERRVHKQKFSKFVEHNNKDEFGLEFTIPYLVPSIHTRNTTSLYFLEVRLDVPWAVDLEVLFPIEIMARDPKLSQLVPLPTSQLIKPSPNKYYKASEFQPYLPEFQAVETYKPDTRLQVQNFPPANPSQQPTYIPAPDYYEPNYSLYMPGQAQAQARADGATPTAQPAPVAQPAVQQAQAAGAPPAAQTTEASSQTTAKIPPERPPRKPRGPFSYIPGGQAPFSYTPGAKPAIIPEEAAVQIQAQNQFGEAVSLTKKSPLKKELSRTETLSHLPSAPPLYPAIAGYEYPTNINAAVVQYGQYEMDDDEKGLLAK